eukprot:GHRQ01032678.1.p1 GENE.GHRQ01032678.1~~GHRQ01032678.1.p1  ORF type:complete len:126 (-),score=46.53 GHRQ01032678.1:310-687(-)
MAATVVAMQYMGLVFTIAYAIAPLTLLPAHPISTLLNPAAIYFAVIRCIEGHPELVMTTLQSKFLPTLAANYMIWPLAHIINFRFVPSEYRILYNNVVCIARLTGLSFLTHSKINFMQLLHLPHF